MANNYSIRLPEELKAKLQEKADKEGRTLANMIIYILNESIKSEK